MKTKVKKLSEIGAETQPPPEGSEHSNGNGAAPIVDGRPVVTREMFFSPERNPKLPTEWVPVPERGGWMLVSELSASRQDLWESVKIKVVPGENLPGPGNKRIVVPPRVETDYTDYRARAVALSLVDPVSGDWLCTLDDAPEIGRMGKRVVTRLFAAYRRLNDVSDADLAELEAALKNGLSTAG